MKALSSKEYLGLSRFSKHSGHGSIQLSQVLKESTQDKAEDILAGSQRAHSCSFHSQTSKKEPHKTVTLEIQDALSRNQTYNNYFNNLYALKMLYFQK